MTTIRTKTKDGIEFTGLLFEAKESKKIVIHIHGMSGDIYINSFYPAMQSSYPTNGYSLILVEHRGTHSITQFNCNNEIRNIGNTYEIFEDCIYDIEAWIEKATQLGYEEIWLQSHSLSPSKVAYYMSKVKETPVKGLIMLSPSDMIGLVNEDKEYSNHQKRMNEAESLIKQGKGEQILSDDLWGDMKLSANTYVNFFGEKSNLAIFNYHNETLGWNVVNSISVPVIAFTGTKDDGIVTVMDPYKAMDILTQNLINSPRKMTVVYKDADHDFTGFGEHIVKDAVSFMDNIS